jgi:LPXTG-motif cell wall-anchored protein
VNRLRRTGVLLAAVAAGIVGVFVVATPASAHFSTVVAEGSCVNGNPTITFTIYSHINQSHEWVQIVPKATLTNPSGTAPTQAELGINTTRYHIPANQDTYAVTQTTPITVLPGQKLRLDVTLYWYSAETGGGYVTKSDSYAKGTGPSNCETPAAPTVNFEDTCDQITVTFHSNVAQLFKVVLSDTSVQDSGTKMTDFSLTVPATAAPLSAYADGSKIGDHTYSKPQYCGAPSGTIESTCDGIVVTLTNPADGKQENVSVTYTPNVGSPVTLTAGRGETKTYTFPGTSGLQVTYTPVDGSGTQTVSWAPDAAKCAPPRTATPTPTTTDLPKTGSNVTGMLVGGGVLVAAGVALLASLLLMRRRRSATGG